MGLKEKIEIMEDILAFETKARQDKSKWLGRRDRWTYQDGYMQKFAYDLEQYKSTYNNELTKRSNEESKGTTQQTVVETKGMGTAKETD